MFGYYQILARDWLIYITYPLYTTGHLCTWRQQDKMAALTKCFQSRAGVACYILAIAICLAVIIACVPLIIWIVNGSCANLSDNGKSKHLLNNYLNVFFD